MTREQMKYYRLASKYRRWAGELQFTDHMRVPSNVGHSIQAAHDSLWNAIKKLEELSGV